MKEISKLTDWIDLTKPTMCQWICNYLAKKNKLFRTYNELFAHDEICKFQAESLKNIREDSKENRDFINKMRNAWRQQRYRSNHDSKSRKQTNFVLSEQAIKELSFLAIYHKKSSNKVLEALIAGDYQTVKTKSRQAKEKKNKLKYKFENSNLWIEAYNSAPRKKLEEAIKESDLLQKQYNALLLELEQLRSITEKKEESSESNPNTSQVKITLKRKVRPYMEKSKTSK